MDKERLKEIAERAAKATPGPWIQSYLQPLYTVTMDSAVVVSGAEFNEDGSVDFIFADNESQAGENLRFIARARSDIPDLLAHIHTLEEQNGRLREAMAEVMGLVEAGELVRDVSHDGESGWMLKNMRLVRILADARRAALAPPAPTADKCSGCGKTMAKGFHDIEPDTCNYCGRRNAPATGEMEP